jgi:endonuclease/exonuclease/phosphatase family metal-dependent hydrolase
LFVQYSQRMSYVFRDFMGVRMVLLAFVCWGLAVAPSAFGQDSPQGVNLRVMAANLPGNTQKIEPYAINIFKGLKPDVVAIQEFNCGDNSTEAFQSFVSSTFGPDFSWYREPISGIPNGVISRYPFVQAGSWADPLVSNRGFAWAQIDVPGTNDLYVVSVHFLTSGSGDRTEEANTVKARILSTFPAGAWIIVAGDFNTGSRSETAVTTFSGFLSDSPIPTDAVTGGNSNTSLDRSKPYDYVLVSHSMTNRMTNTVVGTYSFAKGLVFDSRVFPNVEANVPPVKVSDSGQGQHMAVVKDFHIGTGLAGSLAPYIVEEPQDQNVLAGGTATFRITAGGAEPLSYQWRSNGVAMAGATGSTYSITNAQLSAEGDYRVVITNQHGSITSAVAILRIVSAGGEGVLAGWDVSGLSGYGPSPFAATTNAALLSIGGLTRGPGAATTSTAANNAWGGNGFDASSTSAAIAAGDYVSWSISAGEGVAVSFSSIDPFWYRRSSTGPPSGVLQAQVGSFSFSNIAALSFTAVGTATLLPPLDLSSVALLQNVPAQTTVTFRLVLYGATSSGGTWYVFNSGTTAGPDLVVTGRVQPVSGPPALPPTISAVGGGSGDFQFQVSGSTGSNYVVEACSNLGGVWSAIATNVAPFIFTETNGAAGEGRFFRVRAR